MEDRKSYISLCVCSPSFQARMSYGVKKAQQFTQTEEWVMECVCLCARTFRPFLTAREWSQSAIIPSEVEGSLLDSAIHQP